MMSSRIGIRMPSIASDLRLVTRRAALREALADAWRGGARVSLVPTMGALHAGHLSLVAEARRRSDVVVMSVFVNPLQFGPNEDFARYPRRLDADVAHAQHAGVDLIFAPPVDEMYPDEPVVSVRADGVADVWEGAVRPGHFRGVLTVVAKLFNLVRPDVAVFGQKDIQQAVLVRAMIRDFDFPIELVVAPTVREHDGLALSSRNVSLGAEDRARAASLSAALRTLEREWTAGERSADVLERAARRVIDMTGGVRVDYLAVVDPQSLAHVEHAEAGSIAILAARVGVTRLLDNIILGGPGT
jgi:pantoate--beta-alanine ligase